MRRLTWINSGRRSPSENQDVGSCSLRSRSVGKAVGDTKLESQGKVDKIEGKVQNAIGGLKDTLRGK